MIAVRTSLVPFLIVSSAFHLLLALSWYARYDAPPVTQNIPVTVIPSPPEEKPALEAPINTPTPRPPKETPGRSEPPVGQLAKKSRPGADETEKSAPRPADKDSLKEQPVNPKTRRTENETVVSRGLPTLKDLVPPAYQLYADRSAERSNDNNDKPIRLDSRDPRYVAYLSSVERAILVAWNNPYVAKSRGIQGRLVLQFTILANGHLEDLHLNRSSGYSELDQEALRIVQAAAPFNAIPRSVGRSRIPIDATFIYEKEGLSYSLVPSSRSR